MIGYYSGVFPYGWRRRTRKKIEYKTQDCRWYRNEEKGTVDAPMTVWLIRLELALEAFRFCFRWQFEPHIHTPHPRHHRDDDQSMSTANMLQVGLVIIYSSSPSPSRLQKQDSVRKGYPPWSRPSLEVTFRIEQRAYVQRPITRHSFLWRGWTAVRTVLYLAK